MSRIDESMPRMNESCHVWISHVTYNFVVSHMSKSCRLWMSRFTHIQVFVGGLDANTGEDDLKEYFGKFGEVAEVQIMVDPVLLYIYIYIYMYVCIYVQTYMYIYIYVYTITQIYLFLFCFSLLLVRFTIPFSILLLQHLSLTHVHTLDEQFSIYSYRCALFLSLAQSTPPPLQHPTHSYTISRTRTYTQSTNTFSHIYVFVFLLSCSRGSPRPQQCPTPTLFLSRTLMFLSCTYTQFIDRHMCAY